MLYIHHLFIFCLNAFLIFPHNNICVFCIWKNMLCYRFCLETSSWEVPEMHLRNKIIECGSRDISPESTCQSLSGPYWFMAFIKLRCSYVYFTQSKNFANVATKHRQVCRKCLFLQWKSWAHIQAQRIHLPRWHLRRNPWSPTLRRQSKD